ncbi:hypothetical protein SS1G_01016 [Sclerotinia sclerotiorum 1980 UF-70]|uniref:Uncharacterized protein n=1 Tax=Sclerotinia sclerotiorum (strain ATCC 18683 / 1980 / Ss-1) TaxID=665079 RepID=A7E6U1_SCLS1|nr:hypothetical protein SS1G_01016 [Sclerotinia sclerotiorum 1980 UF-70]EDN91613.1 hypothetical protein SS1G_01016 [Sclerotinia sclerotiorum 1980 UF-70]
MRSGFLQTEEPGEVLSLWEYTPEYTACLLVVTLLSQALDHCVANLA